MITVSKLKALTGAVEAVRSVMPFPSKYQLQLAAAKTVSMGRVASCSRYSTKSEGADLLFNGYRARLSGLVRCKAHQKCPFCHDIWLADNRRKTEALIGAWDGAIAALTLTVGHRASEPYCDVVRRLQAVRERFMASPEVRRWKGLAFLTSVETLFGESGWHPHIHGLIFSNSPLTVTHTATLEGVWRRCLREVAGRASKKSAKIISIDRAEAQRIGMYTFKRTPLSHFDLLAVIADGRAAKSVISTAQELWRDYCKGLAAVKGMRFVSVKGAEVKLAWATLCKDAKRQSASEFKLTRYAQDIEALGGSEDVVFPDAILKYIHPLSSSTQRAILVLREQLEEAMERRSEAGYYDDLDPTQEVSELAEQLMTLCRDRPPKEQLVLAKITLQGLKLLSVTHSHAKLEAVHTVEQLERFFAELFATLKGSAPSSPLYVTDRVL